MGIRPDATLTYLWRNGQLKLPPARSEHQINLQLYLFTIQLFDFVDLIEWSVNGNVTNSYSTGIIYNSLKDHGPKVTWNKVVWFSGGIQRHQFLTLLFVLNRCSTKDRLLAWGLHKNPTCVLCNSGAESRDHLFFECSFSRALWDEISRCCSMPSHRN